MGDQRELFGPVASVPAAWRALKEAASGGDRARRRIMVTCDGAGASHDLVKELDRLASRHGYQVT